MAQLYYVQPGDTLFKIARSFGVTVDDILAANVICNRNLISVDMLLIIPDAVTSLPKAGGGPYYVVRMGDSLWCLSRQFNIPVSILARNNQISNPSRIAVGQELLLVDEIPDPVQLKAQWEQTGGPNCEIFGFQLHGLYVYSFSWAALGRWAIPYLLDLLHHHCAEIRYYIVMSLGRIGQDHRVTRVLRQMLHDSDENVAQLAEVAIKRIELVRRGNKRVHVLIDIDNLLPSPHMAGPGDPIVPLSRGDEMIVCTWFIPSPTGEEGPRGDIQLYEYVLLLKTGQKGFIARRGLNEISYI